MNGDEADAGPPATTLSTGASGAANNGRGMIASTGARLAQTQEDRRSAFRLRYEVYIAEQGKPYPAANHKERLLADALDDDGEIIVAEADRQIVGTVRGNWFDSQATQQAYPDMFDVVLGSHIPPKCAGVCSRLAALPDHRHSQARELLFEAIYERGLARDTKLCFATCAPMLARLFRRYGFREYSVPVHDPVAGTLRRLLLVLDDIEHLSAANSAFVHIAERHGIRPQSRPWLNEMFASHGAATPASLRVST